MVRATAADALGFCGTATARPFLRQSLTDPDPETRLLAAHALLRLHDPDAKELAAEVRQRETRFRWGRRRLWRDLTTDLTERP